MNQLFKTLNYRTISQYLTCYCNNIIAMPIHTRQGFVIWLVKRLAVHSLGLLHT